jgi:uncharacterized protein
MARPRNSRTVFDPPKFKGFKPHGYYAQENDPLMLLFEEYTSLRLCDYELLTHAEASRIMEISRPTFTRLYESARRKIAQAFIEVRAIEVEKGDAFFDAEWFHCKACNIFYNNPSKKISSRECPLCHSLKTESMSGN